MPNRDIAAALGLLTRLPVPVDFDHAQTRGAQAAWAWPLAGALVGGLAALVGVVGAAFGTPAPIAAALALTTQVVITGAMHEDGLADTADGLWGGFDRVRRLEIMKDSHIGAYGTIALVLSLILRWAALSVVFTSGHPLLALIAAGGHSRAMMCAMMAALPNARGAGLAQSVGRPDQRTTFLALGLGGALVLITTGWAVIPLALWTTLAAIGLAMIAKTKIGGQTGDILGATQQLTEIAALITLATLAA